ncbi:equilibrative nucleobase transporter 1-like [Oratosquilla oratoria]|uniref:equilibrative nucleobase transporter 1-like n=1 Tax=Oratosquilla oratoria TaxID=337810 RepID=UPI003F767717
MLLHQDPKLHLTKARRVFIFLVGVIESALFGGAVFGWPQLVHVLKIEGVYSHLCGQHNTTALLPKADNSSVLLSTTVSPTSGSSPSGNPSEVPLHRLRCSNREENVTDTGTLSHQVNDEPFSCAAQDEQFALIYTLTAVAYGVPSVLVGFLLHHAGLWVTRITGGLMLCSGFIALGLTTSTTPGYLMTSMVLMALGGNQLRMSGMQFGDLFPKQRATALTLMSGMYAASAGLFLIFEYTASIGVSRSDTCWFLTCLASLCIFSTFAMPFHSIPEQLNPVAKDHDEKLTREEDPGVLLEASKEVPLQVSLKTLSSGLNQYWFTISLMSVNIYQQTYNMWISSTSCTVAEATLFSNLFSYSSFVTVFFAPLGGIMADCMIRRAGKEKNASRRRYLEIRASFLPLMITNILLLSMYSCLFVFHPISIVLSLLFMLVARPFIVAVFTAYVRIRFPASHFNRLMGIYGTVMSVLLLVQFPHFIWSQHMYNTAHALIVVLNLLAFLNPLHLLWPSLVSDALSPADDVKATASPLIKNTEDAELATK